MILPIVMVLIMYLLLPAALLRSLWKGSVQTRTEWYVKLLVIALFFVWIFFSGRWDWIGYPLRWVWPVLLVAVLFASWKKARRPPAETSLSRKQKWSIVVYAFLALIFGTYNLGVLTSHWPVDEALELSFPLRSGTYYVAHGGSQVQMNYHSAHSAQRYALDILRLNRLGTRAKGLYPKKLIQYEIFEDPVYSPCTGKVIEVRDDLPDLTPPQRDPENPEGNHVILTCDGNDARLLLAHLKRGSVSVKKGEKVKEGQRIGRVGNSGNTSEPHLHIHAERNGAGVPLRFDGRFLVRNALVR
ncbi:M23 family metallopeptidase [Planifilum fimeticola]